jgi:hypothetical protein
MPLQTRDRFVADLIALMRKHGAVLFEHPNELHPGAMSYRFGFKAEGETASLGFGRLYDSLRPFELAQVER